MKTYRNLSNILQHQIKSKLDIMRRNHQETTQVHECIFEAIIAHTNAAVKFSCKMLIAWKNMTNKTFCKTLNDNVTLQNGIATFNQTLSFQTYLLYDKSTGSYLRKDTSLCLLLISMRKPDEEKLVGRIVVDLAQVLNESAYNKLEDHKLAFCSIPNASLTFRIQCSSNNKTQIKPMDLDMDEFSIIARSLNQSGSSNNDQLIHLKNIVSKDMSSQETDKNKQEAQQKAVTAQDPILQRVNFRENEQKIRHRIERNQNFLVDGQAKSDIYVRQHRQIPIQDPKSEEIRLEIGRQEQQNQGNTDEAIQQPRIIDEIDNNEYQQKKDEHTETEDQNKRETPYSINSTELNKRTYDIESNSNSNQPHSNPKNYEQIAELQFQKKKFQNQNKKLEQLLEQAHNNLLYQREETNKWRKLFENSEQKIFRLEAEKDAVIQQLLQQAQESSRLCIELNSKLQKFQNTDLNGQKLKRKLKQAEEANEQSERLRLDIQSQLLQIRFELAQLKAENEDKTRQLQHKQQQIEQMQKQIEELKSSGVKHEEGERSLYKSYSIMSQKQRQNYNQQIQALKRKVNRLTKDLQFTQNVKQNLSHLSHACQELSIQKQTLLIELSNLRAERERALREKKDLQLNQQLKERQDTDDMNKKLEVVQLQLKAVQNQMGRYEDQKEGLLRNIAQLERTLQNANEQNTFLKSLIMEKQGELANNRDENVEKIQKIQRLSRQKDQFIGELQQQITNLKTSLKSSQQSQNNIISSKKNLEEDIEKLKSELQFIQFANAEAKRQLGQHKISLKQKSDQLISAEQRLSNLSNQIAKLETQLSQQNQSIQKSYQNSQTELIQYKHIIDNLQNEKQKNHTNLKQQKQTIDKLYNQIQYLTKNIRDLQTKNKQLQALGQLRAQTSTNAPTTAYAQRSQQENHLENEKISSLERLIDDKSAIIELKERQIEQMAQNAELDATKIIELEERISRFAEKQAKMRQNILILEEESRKIFDIVVEKQQNQQLQAQLIEEKDVQIDKLRGIINDKALQLQLTYEQLAEYKRQLTQISHGQHGTNIDVAHRDTADNEPGIHEYQRQLQTLQALKAQLQISRKKEKEEIQRKQGLISKLEQQINEKNEMLAQETRKSTKKINEMKFKVQEYQAKNQELTKENNFLLENKLVSENQIKVLLNEKRVCLADIDRLKHRIKELLNQNSQLQSKIIPSINVQAGSQPQHLNQGYKIQLQVEKSKVTELTDHLQILQQSLQKYQESIEKEKQNAVSKEQKLKQNQLLMQQVQSKLEESQTRANDLKLKYQQAEFRSTQHQYQINDYETELQSMRRQLDQASSQVQYFHHLSQQYQQKLKKLQQNKSHLQSISQTAQPNSNNQMMNLKQQIVLLEAQVSSQDNQLKQLKEQLAKANENVVNLKSQIQDREVQKMNGQLHKQFQSIKGKIKEEFGKGNAQNMSNSNYQDIIEACRCLQQLIKQRSQKDKTESIIQLMVSKNAILEEQLNKITEQRGIVQQSARKLSMQFQKIKAKILKGKGSHQEKNELLSSLKPAESKVKDLVELTEKIFDSQLDSETY